MVRYPCFPSGRTAVTKVSFASPVSLGILAPRRRAVRRCKNQKVEAHFDCNAPPALSCCSVVLVTKATERSWMPAPRRRQRAPMVKP